MKKRILDYRKRIDGLLKAPAENTNWDTVLQEHLTQISFFQHERLVHLIVTALVAILTMISAAIFLITEYLPILLLTLLFMVLLVPYINHYYLLENQVQHMYGQYDKILEYKKKS